MKNSLIINNDHPLNVSRTFVVGGWVFRACCMSFFKIAKIETDYLYLADGSHVHAVTCTPCDEPKELVIASSVMDFPANRKAVK